MLKHFLACRRLALTFSQLFYIALIAFELVSQVGRKVAKPEFTELISFADKLSVAYFFSKKLGWLIGAIRKIRDRILAERRFEQTYEVFKTS